MDRNWIEFESGPDRPISGLYVTLNWRGYIVFSRGVFEKMNSPEAFVLLFDRATNTIGVKPALPLMPNAFRANGKSASGTRIIYAKPFCKKYEIKIDGTVRFRNAAIEDGILVLPLGQLEIIRMPNRGPRGPSRPQP